jgi:hypothetical protein
MHDCQAPLYTIQTSKNGYANSNSRLLEIPDSTHRLWLTRGPVPYFQRPLQLHPKTATSFRDSFNLVTLEQCHLLLAQAPEAPKWLVPTNSTNNNATAIRALNFKAKLADLLKGSVNAQELYLCDYWVKRVEYVPATFSLVQGPSLDTPAPCVPMKSILVKLCRPGVQI